jgi:protein-L-isoaspartate(D-aspartate) O-methyltransferase
MVRTQLQARDVTDPRVLAVMASVPRQLFVPAAHRARAWDDQPLPIGHGQTISQPYMVAFMTQALELRGSERILEVGTGCGYQTAVLAGLCRKVFSVELIPELSASAAVLLAELGCANVCLRTGDGSRGWPEHAPYDRVLVTAAAPSIPSALRDQLADNGIMVIPVGDWRGGQDLLVAKKTGRVLDVQVSIGCRFVPLLGQEGFPAEDR